ncbi:MAG: tetratricopeptide repeat protein [Myxococcota bacterium]
MDDRLGPLRGPLLALVVALGAAWPVSAAEPDRASVEAASKRLEQARSDLWRWRLDEAEEALDAEAPGRLGLDRDVLLARLDLQRSRYEQVVERLTPVVREHPDLFEARVVLGRALYATGDATRGFEVLDEMATSYNEGKVTAPEDLMWLGAGLHLTDYPKNANQVYRDALAGDPDLHRARVLWADLFVDKYNFRDSDALYREVLDAHPDDPRALLGLARVDIESDRAFSDARDKATKVLADAPKAVPAHNLLARIDLENERHRAAIDRLEERSLEVAPKDREALALLGAAYFLADDRAGFREVEKRALALDPRFARFYTTASEHASRMHRYEEAAALDEEALKLDPEHWPAYVNLGIGMSRLGRDDEALEHLKKAYRGDPYDVRTFNLLDLFYDGAIRHFEWVEAPPMRVRVRKGERAILERYVPGLLKEAYDHLVDKYDMEPDEPLHVELFPSEELFAVRSTGLPRLQAHGICFGHVVTARSPSAGNFNWAQVLWHELSHVFHIQMSNSRVPRWFTEGLAVYEATEGRPEWRREMDEELLAWREAGRLRGVDDFNLSFTRAERLQDILVAYYHAYRMAEFIDAEFGTDAMKRMLVLWGEKKPTAEVFREALGVEDLDAFDRRFLTWLDEKLAHLREGFRLGEEAVAPEAEALAEKADAAPEDASAQAAAAVAWLGRGDARRAALYAKRALELDVDQAEARMVRAMLRHREGKADGARADLEALLEAGHDGVRVRKLLAVIARQRGEPEQAVEHLERAIALDPQQGSLYYALVELLDELGRDDDAWTWRKKTLAVDQMSVKLVESLLEGAKEHDASKEDILHWGEMGNHIAPFSVEHHLLFARELKRLGLDDRARFEATSALILEPDNEEARKLGGTPPERRSAPD